MGKKLFWSRDRLVKHEFDCLGFGLCIVVRVLNSFGVMVMVMVRIRVYVKPFCTAEKP